MRRVCRIFFIIVLTVMATSCVKEGHVVYRFEILNATDMPMTVRLSSWGKFRMFINSQYSSKYKFHEVETIHPSEWLIFDIEIGDDPNPRTIPPSVTPAWEYITAIEYEGVSIPAEFYKNPDNWEISVALQINGTFTSIRLDITPELLEQFVP